MPPAANEDYERRRGWVRGSINDLEIWLAQRFDNGLFTSRIDPEIKVIRAVQKIRNIGVHPGKDSHHGAAKARQRLGLPSPIVDWAEAWQRILDRLAAAFDVIRLELQAAQRAD